MDPYTPPGQLWDIPRPAQLYGPLTLNGNWLERRALSEDLELFEKEITPMKRAAARRAQAFTDSRRPLCDTGHRDDGGLYAEDAIHLTCTGMIPSMSRSGIEEKPALVIDMSDLSQVSGTAYAYGTISDSEPTARSVFVIKSADNRNYPRQTRRICYGEPIILCSVMEWHGMEWRLTSGPECTYDINLDHRKPTVWLHPFPSAHSLWKLQCVDRSLHPIMENEYVDSRHPVLLVHVLTGRCLTVNFQKRFKTPYGNEYLMVCDTDFSRGRPEMNNSRFSIRMVSYPPWKHNQQQEHKFRQNLESQIDDVKKVVTEQCPTIDRNMVGFNMDREPAMQGPSADGWYNHQLHSMDTDTGTNAFQYELIKNE